MGHGSGCAVFSQRETLKAMVSDLRGAPAVMGHGAWVRLCGLLPKGDAKSDGVGPAWSTCRHGAWEKDLTLFPRSHVPIVHCPIPNAQCPMPNAQF